MCTAKPKCWSCSSRVALSVSSQVFRNLFWKITRQRWHEVKRADGFLCRFTTEALLCVLFSHFYFILFPILHKNMTWFRYSESKMNGQKFSAGNRSMQARERRSVNVLHILNCKHEQTFEMMHYLYYTFRKIVNKSE